MMDLETDSVVHVTFFSKEEENYLRIANLLIKVAPNAVRVKFDKELHPDVLQTVLTQNKYKILDSLKRKKVINRIQWDLLFPSSGEQI